MADGSPIPEPPATLHSLKWMPGDVVCCTTRAVIKRTCGRIVGIIDVLNRVRFGTNARGIPLYIMYPIDVAYPPFLVALKTKPATNILAVAKYEHWEGVWPRAGLEKQIGSVGDLNSEIQAILQTLPAAAAPLSAHAPAHAPTSTPPAAAVKHAEFDWDVVLNIDPPGCKDVDDVLCWKRRDDGTVHFGIGIADVAHWVTEGSVTDRCAFERGATLYCDGRPIEPMLPAEISESSASLRCDGIKRPAICLTFDIQPSGVRSAGCWELQMLKVTESYTYDSIYSNEERAEQVRRYLSAVCDSELAIGSSHEWVERAMILYNRRVAEELQHAGVGLLRAHCGGVTNEEYTALAMKTGCREIAWLGSSAGRYVIPQQNTGHNGLSLACYTHASSPLRRYVDLLNQRWIRALFFGYPPPTTTAATATTEGQLAHDCNMSSKRIRRMERDMHFLTQVLGGGGIVAAHGFVLNIAATTAATSEIEKMRVYVPQWKRVVSCVATSKGIEQGARITVRMYLDTRQGDWSRRFIYQALKSPHDEFN